MKNRVYGLTNRSLSESKVPSKTNIENNINTNTNNSNSNQYNNNNILIDNKMYDFFLFNKSGVCVLEKTLHTIIKDPNEYIKYKLLIKNISHNLLLNCEKKNNIAKNNYNNDEKENNEKLNLNINKMKQIENEFVFKNFQFEKCKILFLIRNNLIFVGTFPVTSSTQFQRLLLIHLFIALINFKGDSIIAMKKINNYETYDKNNYINLKSFYKKKLQLSNKEINDILELLIFEYYFLKIIIIHFTKVFNEIFKKEFLNLNQTRFKNLYILDLETSSIILDMLKMQGNRGDNHNKKYIKNKNLFDEILYHSKNMYNSYVNENGMRFVTFDSIYRFVKFECTSTFPRLLFIIKFIPVLKGIAVIHLYYQKKLSRNLENNPLEQELRYREIDLLFGSYIRENQNLEFKYGAPKKLQHIEKFFEDFFVTSRSGYDIFRVSMANKFKYVNYNIINIINSVPVSNNVDIEKIFEDINKKLENEYNSEQIKSKENLDDDDENREEEEGTEDNNSVNKIFILNKEDFYNELLNQKNKNNKNKDKDNKVLNKENNNKIKDVKPSINLYKKKITNIFADSVSKSYIIEEDKKDEKYKSNKSFMKKIENQFISKIHINNLMLSEESTERKKLIKNDIDVSSEKVMSKFGDISMISEVKSKEKFKYKVIGVKSQRFKDKLNNLNNLYNNPIDDNNDNYKLSDLLDFTTNNQNKNNKYQEKSDINNNMEEEECKDNILDKNTKSSKNSKNESKKVIINSVSDLEY